MVTSVWAKKHTQMKNFRITRYVTIAAIAGLTLSLNSCKKEGCTDETATNFNSEAKKDDGSCVYPTPVTPTPTPTPTPEVADTKGLTKIGTATTAAGATSLELYSKSTLYPGMNKLYVVAMDAASNELIKDGKVTFTPMMKMNSGMEHSAPVLNSTAAANDQGLYSGDVFFVMPSDAGSWMLKTKFMNNSTGTESEVSFDITVTQNSNRMMVSFMDTTTADSNAIFLSYALDEIPTVGSNELKIVAFTRKTMMSWPAADDLTIEFEPSMPSMGHGSPNNVNPSFKSSGTYVGTVNYTMTGKWRLDVTVKRNGKVLNDEIYFEYTL